MATDTTASVDRDEAIDELLDEHTQDELIEDELIEDELLIEEIAIDGMCGVY